MHQASVEVNVVDQEDCQMQPLDLSCPKVSQSHEEMLEGGGHHLMSPRLFDHRPRSSSGGSDESFEAAEAAEKPRNLTKAALKQWPIPNIPSPALLGGPARKRFLTKYLHKETGEQ
jgi:hypothetical protein